MVTKNAPCRRRSTTPAVLLLIAGFGALALWGLPVHGPEPAPAVRLTLVDGSATALEQWRGRPLLVTFWSLSCPPCIEEIPDLVRLHEENRANDLAVVAIAAPYDPPAAVRTFVERQNLPYTVALDTDAGATRAFDGVPYLPATFLIDPDGRIVFRHTGRLDIARVQSIIQGFARR
jgi:peroxiredoxin